MSSVVTPSSLTPALSKVILGAFNQMLLAPLPQVMVVQLNIRKMLEEACLPPINIIGQKVASEGLTRFEDRSRLPLGISVNFTSFAAKMLTLVGEARGPPRRQIIAMLLPMDHSHHVCAGWGRIGEDAAAQVTNNASTVGRITGNDKTENALGWPSSWASPWCLIQQ